MYIHNYTYTTRIHMWRSPKMGVAPNQIIQAIRPWLRFETTLATRNFWDCPISRPPNRYILRLKLDSTTDSSSVPRAPAVRPSRSPAISSWASSSPRRAAGSRASASPYDSGSDGLGPPKKGCLATRLVEIFAVTFWGDQSWWILEGFDQVLGLSSQSFAILME